MQAYFFINLIESLVLLGIIAIIYRAYLATKNTKLLFGSIAFFLFLVSNQAIFFRNYLHLEGFVRTLFYLLDFGYLGGMIILLKVYEK